MIIKMIVHFFGIWLLYFYWYGTVVVYQNHPFKYSIWMKTYELSNDSKLNHIYISKKIFPRFKPIAIITIILKSVSLCFTLFSIVYVCVKKYDAFLGRLAFYYFISFLFLTFILVIIFDIKSWVEKKKYGK